MLLFFTLLPTDTKESPLLCVLSNIISTVPKPQCNSLRFAEIIPSEQ